MLLVVFGLCVLGAFTVGLPGAVLPEAAGPSSAVVVVAGVAEESLTMVGNDDEGKRAESTDCWDPTLYSEPSYQAKLGGTCDLSTSRLRDAETMSVYIPLGILMLKCELTTDEKIVLYSSWHSSALQKTRERAGREHASQPPGAFMIPELRSRFLLPFDNNRQYAFLFRRTLLRLPRHAIGALTLSLHLCTDPCSRWQTASHPASEVPQTISS